MIMTLQKYLVILKLGLYIIKHLQYDNYIVYSN